MCFFGNTTCLLFSVIHFDYGHTVNGIRGSKIYAMQT